MNIPVQVKALALAGYISACAVALSVAHRDDVSDFHRTAANDSITSRVVPITTSTSGATFTYAPIDVSYSAIAAQGAAVATFQSSLPELSMGS